MKMKYLKPLFAELKQGNTWKWIGIGFALMYGLTSSMFLLQAAKIVLPIKAKQKHKQVTKVVFNFVTFYSPFFINFDFCE